MMDLPSVVGMIYRSLFSVCKPPEFPGNHFFVGGKGSLAKKKKTCQFQSQKLF